MLKIINLVALPLLAAALTTFFITPTIIKIAWKIGIIDDPKKNKHPKVIHTYPTPRGGGLAIFSGVVVSSLLFLPLDKHSIGILFGGLILSILGILDDKYNLHPIGRLIVQFIVACFPIASGIGIAYISNPFGGIIDLSHPQITFSFLGDEKSIWLLSDLFALFWIVTLMNFINMGAKGVDGQLTGTVIVAAATISILSLKYSADITQWPVIILSSITTGAYLGFLPWHIYPQKIMPGFGGSTLAGFLLGVLSILSTTKVGTLMVVLAVPLIDTSFTILRRILSGKSPFWGDRGHLHHKLLDLGLSKMGVAYFYWGITAILGVAAINLNASSKFYTIIGVSILLGGSLILLTKKK